MKIQSAQDLLVSVKVGRENTEKYARLIQTFLPMYFNEDFLLCVVLRIVVNRPLRLNFRMRRGHGNTKNLPLICMWWNLWEELCLKQENHNSRTRDSFSASHWDRQAKKQYPMWAQGITDPKNWEWQIWATRLIPVYLRGSSLLPFLLRILILSIKYPQFYWCSRLLPIFSGYKYIPVLITESES